MADLCWGSNNATLSLGCMTTELLWDEAKGTWFTANGDGSKVELVKDTSRHTRDKEGEYWIITTRDGTRYHFGLNRLPGWSSNNSLTTNDYQPTSTTLSLPQSIANTWGLRTSYTYDYTYTDTGLPESTGLPAVGNFPTEKVLVRYTKDGLPLSVSGQGWYGSETVYSPYGQALRSTLGAQPYRVWTMSSYDDGSGALTDQQVYREQTGDKNFVNGNLVSKRSYRYDDAGNATAIREHAAGIEEQQCFRHDALGQLTKAWTAKAQAENQTPCTAEPTGTRATSPRRVRRSPPRPSGCTS